MLSDKEWKAFESVKDMFGDVTLKDIDEQSITIYGIAMLDVIKVLTIVEKLSKEIEELKEENKKLTDEYLVQRDLINPDFLKDYISKDKIKAKMKEKEWSLQNYDCTEADYKQSQAIGAWSVLQSLLEKE